MKIRALRTFSVFHDGQVHVFNAGKNGEPGEAREVEDDLAVACLETGHAERVEAEAVESEPAEPPALTGKNKAALLAIAESERVIIADGATNAEIVEMITAVRNGEMALVEGEADAEEAPPA